MNLGFQNINWSAVAVSAVATFLLGGLWYTALFGPLRTRLCSYDETRVAAMQQLRPPALFFGGQLASYLVVAVVIAVLFASVGVVSASSGLAVGILVWLIAAAIGMTGHLAADLPIGVLAIDATFQLIFLGMMGAIIGGWRASS